MHFAMPFHASIILLSDHFVTGQQQQTVYSIHGKIGDSRSWMKMTFFLCKIFFRTHGIIIKDKKGTKKKSQKDERRVGWGVGVGYTFMVSLNVKYPFFYASPISFLFFCERKSKNILWAIFFS